MVDESWKIWTLKHKCSLNNVSQYISYWIFIGKDINFIWKLLFLIRSLGILTLCSEITPCNNLGTLCGTRDQIRIGHMQDACKTLTLFCLSYLLETIEKHSFLSICACIRKFLSVSRRYTYLVVSSCRCRVHIRFKRKI